MRRLLVAIGLFASISGATAADYELPTLRGAEAVALPVASACCPRWEGFYVGGQVGYGFAAMDFTGSTKDLVSHMLRELALENVAQVSTWQVVGKADTTGGSYGGFIGYNIQWENLILGFEFNYSRINFFADAPVEPITRVTSAGGNTYLVTVTGGASMRITDMATVRARAGFEIGNFLPYFMIGAAVGRADLTRTATAFGEENPAIPCGPPINPTCTPFLFTESEVKNGAFIFGVSVGGGLEIMIMPNVFLRGEYEYVGFSPVWDIKANIQTARAGLGVKF
jgi:outer membrane immunogenic protein